MHRARARTPAPRHTTLAARHSQPVTSRGLLHECLKGMAAKAARGGASGKQGRRHSRCHFPPSVRRQRVVPPATLGGTRVWSSGALAPARAAAQCGAGERRQPPHSWYHAGGADAGAADANDGAVGRSAIPELIGINSACDADNNGGSLQYRRARLVLRNVAHSSIVLARRLRTASDRRDIR